MEAYSDDYVVHPELSIVAGRGFVPVQRSPVIGREPEITALVARAVHADYPLLTMTGPGGVGKTRLAIAVAEACRNAFPGGVWFVSFAATRDPSLLLPEIAAALGIRESEPQDTLRRLEEQLRSAPTLLVLDNLEQIVEAGPQISQLLHDVPTLSVLATSREALQVYGESEYPVKPLPTQCFDEAGLSPAEALFLARAQEASFGFNPTEADREAMQVICTRLDGLPLAIELAATWVKLLSLPQLRANLDRQLDLLGQGARDLPERQQTMRSAIAWSYQLLSSEEQLIFRMLSIIPGSFTIEDAVAILRDDPECGERDEHEDLFEVEEWLSSLISKNLITVSQDHPILTESYYSLLQTIRAYGLELLEAEGEYAFARERLKHRFTAIGLRLASGIRGEERQVRLARLDAAVPNLRAALTMTEADGETEMLMRLVNALRRYWDWHGYLAEGRNWCERALAMPGEAPPLLRIEVLYSLSSLAFAQGDYDPSTQSARESLEIARQTGDRFAYSFGLTALGNIAYEQGDLDTAESVYGEALQIRREFDDPVELEIAIVNVAWVKLARNDLAGAESLLRESLQLTEQSGYVYESGWPLSGLALIAHRQGDLEQAANLLRQVVELRRGEDIGLLAGAQVNLAAVERDRGNLERAWELYVEAIGHRASRGERSQVIEALGAIALLAERIGQPELAVALFASGHRERVAIGFGLRDAETKLQDAALSRLRGALAKDRFEAAWNTGETQSIDCALEAIRAVDVASPDEVPGTSSTPSPVAPAAENKVGPLTIRETEVLRLLAGGATDKEIADELFISRATASRHVLNIFQKIGVNSRGAAASWAARNDVR